VLRSFDLNHRYLYSSPAIARNFMHVGSKQGKLVAVDLSGFTTAWPFETEGLKQHGATYTNPDGTPDQVKIFRSDYYDDMVLEWIGFMSMGSILGAPAVGWERGFCRKCGRKRLFVDVKNVKFVK